MQPWYHVPCLIVISYEPPGKPWWSFAPVYLHKKKARLWLRHPQWGLSAHQAWGSVLEENAGKVDRVSHGFPNHFPYEGSTHKFVTWKWDDWKVGKSQVPALSFRSFQTSIHLQNTSKLCSLCLLNSRPKMRLNSKVLLPPPSLT